MENISILSIKHEWALSRWLPVKGSFWHITADTVYNTWFSIGAILVFILFCRFILPYKKNRLRFLIIQATQSLMDLCTQSLGNFSYRHFSFIGSLFLFILFSNLIGLVPFVEEPTTDINTTLALGIISFIYINTCAICKQGIKEYIKEYFSPFFLLFPLNVIGKFASIISLSFRLFGNMLGGAVIMSLFLNTVARNAFCAIFSIVSGINILLALFFGIFEGLIQAFVFTMLSLTYLSLAVQSPDSESHKALA